MLGLRFEISLELSLIFTFLYIMSISSHCLPCSVDMLYNISHVGYIGLIVFENRYDFAFSSHIWEVGRGLSKLTT